MGRRKIEIKAIKDDRNRSVTFLKRKGGLFKKAHELAVLCSVDVAVIIFGHNKKLYEFSSCDMRETLARYQYYGPPHEHKGPDDFNGKGDNDDDDDDEATPGPEEMHHMHHNAPQMVPAHLSSHPSFQHVNHAPSVSPPIPNGMPFDTRHGTPQPQGSRPSSRNHLRRVSSNLGPQQHRATPPPHPPPNGFTYMPNPSMYNPNANPNLGPQPRPGQYPHYGHPPPGPHHQHPPQAMPPHTMAPQSIPPHHQGPQHIPQHPHPHPLAQQQQQQQQPPPMGLSQPPHPSIPQVAQAFLPEQGRNSMPPAFPPEQQPPPRPVSLPDASSADQIQGPVKVEGSPPQHQKPLPSKSRSIFTPIDDHGSVLARFGVGHATESPRNENSHPKAEPKREDSSETKASTQPAAPPPPPKAATEVTRSQSTADIKPPARTNSLPSKRPQLQLQIPSESSDRGSATGESSSRDSAGNKTLTPAKANADANHSGVVLPPPSPSAGAILSAGAQGPPNPFARPPPPGTAAQNNNAYNNNNNIETPISALPSRFVSDALLPSPSSFFPEWGFNRSGPDTNMLPSPLMFPTPAVQTGPGFSRDDEHEKKRKSPESALSAEGTAKKTKT